MEETTLSTIVLPIAIVIIMIAMGMTLTIADFRRVISEPKAVLIGLLCQLIVLPIIGVLVALVMPLEAVFAVSIVLLAASPGGTTSNLISYVADLDRALSVTLTAITNMLSWLTIPILLTVALRLFPLDSTGGDFPIGDVMLPLVALTIVPITIGMLIRRFAPGFVEKINNGAKIFSAVFFLTIVIALVVENWHVIMRDAPRFALSFIVLNVIALGVGLLIARASGLSQKQATTIGLETGLQNSTLTIAVAFAILGNAQLTIIPALYGLWMLFTGLGFAYLFNRNAK